MRKAFFFVLSSDFSRPSASLNRFLAISRGLCEIGDEVYWFLLATEPPSSIKQDSKYGGIRFITVGSSKFVFARNKITMYLYRMWLHSGLGRLVRNLGNEASIKAWFDYGDRIPFLWQVVRICRLNNVVLLHEKTEYPYLGNSLRKRFNQFFYMTYFIPRCDHIFVISQSLKLFYTGYLRTHKRKIPVHVQNIVVEPERYNAKCNPETCNTRDIVYVGTLYGTKDGVYDLIRAFAEVMDEHPYTRLVIVGDTSKRERMHEIYAELSKLSDPSQVVMTGLLQRDEVVRIINSAYCLALARPDNLQAKYGFPTKLGEYLSTGRPVIVTGVGDIPLFLRDGHNAYVAQPGDLNDFVAKLSSCLSNPNEASVIGERGKELSQTVFYYRNVASCLSKAVRDTSNYIGMHRTKKPYKD